MAEISKRFGEGGANLVPQESGGVPSLATVLRDIADDLAGVQGSTVVAAALGAFTDPPSAAEMALLRTLVNELRSAQVTRGTATLLTVKV
jgi:hypothetical protein